MTLFPRKSASKAKPSGNKKDTNKLKERSGILPEMCYFSIPKVRLLSELDAEANFTEYPYFHADTIELPDVVFCVDISHGCCR